MPDAPPAGTYRVLLSARLAAALIMSGLLRADGFCRPFISRCRYAVCTCTFVCRRAQQLCMGSIRPYAGIDAIPRKQIGQLLTGSSPVLPRRPHAGLRACSARSVASRPTIPQNGLASCCAQVDRISRRSRVERSAPRHAGRPPSCRLPAMSPAHDMLRAGFE